MYMYVCMNILQLAFKSLPAAGRSVQVDDGGESAISKSKLSEKAIYAILG